MLLNARFVPLHAIILELSELQKGVIKSQCVCVAQQLYTDRYYTEELKCVYNITHLTELLNRMRTEELLTRWPSSLLWRYNASIINKITATTDCRSSIGLYKACLIKVGQVFDSLSKYIIKLLHTYRHKKSPYAICNYCFTVYTTIDDQEVRF